MSVNITVYSGFSKALNSTKQPSGGTDIGVTLKEPTSVMSPKFIISGFNTSWNYIKWGSRYYFVDDIVILTNYQAEYICSLDVLATYKGAIGSSSQYVTRSDSAYNLNIIDSKYPTYGYSDLETVSFDSLHYDFTRFGSFVIGISNGVDVESAGVTYYTLNGVTMARLLHIMFEGTWLSASDITVELQKELCNPIQYIDSIKWYPFDIANSSLISLSSGSIRFGYWDSGIVAPIVRAVDCVCPFSEQITIPRHAQSGRGNYLNGAPFTQMSLMCYGFGQVPVDANLFVNANALTLSVGVDVMTGLGRMTLWVGSANPKPFYTQYGQIGVECKISQISQGLIESVGNVTGGSFALVAGNPIGYLAGVVSGLQALTPELRTSGSNGSKLCYNQAPRLMIKRQTLAPEDKTQFGRPLCEVRQISSLSGFIQCEDVEVDITGTKAEKSAVISFMEGGFFYE
jgi:hypothetical protein